MTQERHISVWRNCLNFIQQNIDPRQFKLWFTPIRPVSLIESTLTVEVPSEFFREYLAAHQNEFREAVRILSLTGASLDIECFKKDKPGIERVSDDLKKFYNCKNFYFIFSSKILVGTLDILRILKKLTFCIKTEASFCAFLHRCGAGR